METTAALLNPSETLFAAMMLRTMNPAGSERETSPYAPGTILEAAKTPLDEEDEDDDEEDADDDDDDDDLEDDADDDLEDDDDDLEEDDDEDDEDDDEELEDDDDPKPLRVKSRQ